MVFEHDGEHASQWAAISSIAAKIGCNPETLRNWVRQTEGDQGKRPGPTTETNRSGSRRWSARTGNCAMGMRSFARRRRIFPRRSATARSRNDCLHRRAPRAVHGVEPICRVLAIALSSYHAHAARRARWIVWAGMEPIGLSALGCLARAGCRCGPPPPGRAERRALSVLPGTRAARPDP